MPEYTQNHLLMRMGGDAAQGQETWSCGVRMIQNATTDPDEMLEFAQSAVGTILDACREWWVDPASDTNELCMLQYVDLNPIGTDGRYLFPNTPVQALAPGDGYSGSAGVPGPLQLAYCVTMRAWEYRRGPAALGRFYVPTAGASVTSTAVMPAALAQQYANAAGDLLEAIQVVGASPEEALRVRLLGDGVGGPRISRVRTVQVGNVYDTQRRRRRQIAETYLDATTWTEPEG